MARIRSIHPGQASDEDFVEMSAEARLFCLLLRCEADDQGVFEWKPKALKMRLIPADDWDAAAILEELVAHRQVKRFEAEGREYGAIRNFRKYQRPKKPNAVHPCPREMLTYVGIDPGDGPDDPEPVPHQFPTSSEIPPQMEDGGWRMEEERGEITQPDPNLLEAAREPDPPSGRVGSGENIDPSESLELQVMATVAWAHFGELAHRIGLPPPGDPGPDDPRMTRLVALAVMPAPEPFGVRWERALRRIEASPFLRGEAGDWAGVTLGWLVKAANFAAVLDGRYAKHADGPAARSVTAAEALEIWGQTGDWPAGAGAFPAEIGPDLAPVAARIIATLTAASEIVRTRCADGASFAARRIAERMRDDPAVAGEVADRLAWLHNAMSQPEQKTATGGA